MTVLVRASSNSPTDRKVWTDRGLVFTVKGRNFNNMLYVRYVHWTEAKGYHLDVVRGPSTPHDPESDAGGSLSSWQGHPSQ
jgi:hypothetical protein